MRKAVSIELKKFEVSSRKSKNGRRKFKVVLHEVYPDSCIDEQNQVGTIYNRNGITWIREYCEKALSTIENMFIRVEFADPNERTEIISHGSTGFEDDLPVFEDAVTIGNFTKGYIQEITDDSGNTKVVCIGEGYLDEMCYNRFVSKLTEEVENDENPFGSIEIYKSENNDGIIYKYGYKEHGRIPMDFIYSGYALLGVRPADDEAKLLELNSKEGAMKMNESEIKDLIINTVNEMNDHTAEINQIKQDCDAQISEANSQKDQAIAEKNEAIANSEKIQSALEDCRSELNEAYKKIDALYEEMRVLNEELGKARAKERIGELNDALSEFTEEERNYAKDEIEAFKADPVNSEINAITDKICVNIVKNAKAAEAKKIAEQNDADTPDIYGMIETQEKEEEISIY